MALLDLPLRCFSYVTRDAVRFELAGDFLWQDM
jgi:hypothetical protein